MRSLLARFSQLEGTLRHYNQLPDGSFADALLYALLADEWPRGREVLQRLVDRRAR